MVRLLATLLVLGLGLLAPASSAQEGIGVGIITSQTGRFATFGRMQMAGYQVALDEINAAGGVKGQPLRLIIEDDTSNQNAALAAAERLINAGVPMILGTYSSSISKPLAAYATRQRIPLDRLRLGRGRDQPARVALGLPGQDQRYLLCCLPAQPG